jgi:hypothetical protein
VLIQITGLVGHGMANRLFPWLALVVKLVLFLLPSALHQPEPL